MKKLTEEERCMREAVRQAKKAWKLGEVPIGCVIVYEGKIIGRGYNRRTTDGNVLAHAEIIAIRKACRAMGVQARIPKVVIGCMNPKAGCAGSVLDLLHEDGFNHQVETEVGMLGEECSQMLKDFFRELREKKKERKKEQQNEQEQE